MDTNRSAGRLAKLIQAAKDSGSSLREIELRAAEAGKQLSYSQVQAYHKGTAAKMPTQQQIEALAAGLPASIAEVRRAAFIDWYGYDLYEHEKDSYLIAVPADLPAQRKREVDQLVRAWLSVNAR